MYQKGYHHTEEEKEKIRQGKLGANNPNFGKKLSPETCAKMSASRTGKKHPKTETMIAKQKESLKKFYNSEDGSVFKEHLSEVNKGTSWHKGFRHEFSDETKKKMGVIQKKKWQDPIERDKRVDAIMSAGKQVPNYRELQLLSYLNEAKSGWEFIGNGKLHGEKFKVGGKCPDFILEGTKLLCEHYGAGYHTEDQVQPRIEFFKQLGYATLIIWQKELKYKEKVIQRIKEFVAENYF
jgi:hypothetical protein